MVICHYSLKEILILTKNGGINNGEWHGWNTLRNCFTLVFDVEQEALVKI